MQIPLLRPSRYQYPRAPIYLLGPSSYRCARRLLGPSIGVRADILAKAPLDIGAPMSARADIAKFLVS